MSQSTSYLKYLKYKAKYMQLKKELEGGGLKPAEITLIWLNMIKSTKKGQAPSSVKEEQSRTYLYNGKNLTDYLITEYTQILPSIINKFVSWVCNNNTCRSRWNRNMAALVAKVTNEDALHKYFQENPDAFNKSDPFLIGSKC